MSDIADESSQQINAGKGYKSVVLEDVTWEQIYSQAKVIFSDTPCSWTQLMWNNVGERKNKSKWHLKGKWKFKISIFCAEGFGWERAPIPAAIPEPKMRLRWPTLRWDRGELLFFSASREQHPSLQHCPKVLPSSGLCGQDSPLSERRTQPSRNDGAPCGRVGRRCSWRAQKMLPHISFTLHYLLRFDCVRSL